MAKAVVLLMLMALLGLGAAELVAEGERPAVLLKGLIPGMNGAADVAETGGVGTASSNDEEKDQARTSESARPTEDKSEKSLFVKSGDTRTCARNCMQSDPTRNCVGPTYLSGPPYMTWNGDCNTRGPFDLASHPYDLRLSGGSESSKGRLEIRFHDTGEWGTVCAAWFTFQDVNVACRELGYGRGRLVRSASLSPSPSPLQYFFPYTQWCDSDRATGPAGDAFTSEYCEWEYAGSTISTTTRPTPSRSPCTEEKLSECRPDSRPSPSPYCDIDIVLDCSKGNCKDDGSDYNTDTEFGEDGYHDCNSFYEYDDGSDDCDDPRYNQNVDDNTLRAKEMCCNCGGGSWTSDSDSDGPPVGLIVGCTLGGLLVVSALGAVAWQKFKNATPTGNPIIITDDDDNDAEGNVKSSDLEMITPRPGAGGADDAEPGAKGTRQSVSDLPPAGLGVAAALAKPDGADGKSIQELLLMSKRVNIVRRRRKSRLTLIKSGLIAIWSIFDTYYLSLPGTNYGVSIFRTPFVGDLLLRVVGLISSVFDVIFGTFDPRGDEVRLEFFFGEYGKAEAEDEPDDGDEAPGPERATPRAQWADDDEDGAQADGKTPSNDAQDKPGLEKRRSSLSSMKEKVKGALAKAKEAALNKFYENKREDRNELPDAFLYGRVEQGFWSKLMKSPVGSMTLADRSGRPVVLYSQRMVGGTYGAGQVFGRLEVPNEPGLKIETRRLWSSWKMRYFLFHQCMAFGLSPILQTAQKQKDKKVIPKHTTYMRGYPSLGRSPYAVITTTNKSSSILNPEKLYHVLQDFNIDYENASIKKALEEYGEAGEAMLKAIDAGADLHEVYEEIEDARKERKMREAEELGVRPILASASIIIANVEASEITGQVLRRLRALMVGSMTAAEVTDADGLESAGASSFSKTLEKGDDPTPHVVLKFKMESTRRFYDDFKDAMSNERRVAKWMTHILGQDVLEVDINGRVSKKFLDSCGDKTKFFCKDLASLREGGLADDGKCKVKFKGNSIAIERRLAALLHGMYTVQKWGGRARFLSA